MVRFQGPVPEGFDEKKFRETGVTEKTEEKRKKKGKEGKPRDILKALKKKGVYKKVLKDSKVTVKIPEYKAPSILGDENRFFTGELHKETKEMFFS